MCGLGGEVRFDGALADVAALERMAEKLRPRGPDGSGSWASGRVALLHRRLRIIDLSEAGAQPMIDRPTASVSPWRISRNVVIRFLPVMFELDGPLFRSMFR